MNYKHSIIVVDVIYFDQSLGAAHILTLVEIFIFHVFNGKKLKKGKKATNRQQSLSKNVFFWFVPKRWSKVLFP